MAIRMNLDVVMAERKIGLTELSREVGYYNGESV